MSNNKIETAIKEKMTGNKQESALKFINAICEIGITVEDTDCHDRWNFIFQNSADGFACCQLEDDGKFNIWIMLNFGVHDGDDDLKEFAWSHVVECPQPQWCNEKGCGRHKNTWVIYGKEYVNTCHAPLAFFAVDEEMLDKVKRLFLNIN